MPYRLPLAVAATLLILLPTASPAPAALAPASVIDGPSASILDVDGAAMASDGTGGILYRKLVEGEPHLFVARFLGGAWQPSIQVDGGQPFAATLPAIAAGDGGRLLVVWAEPYATIKQVARYQLMSAEIDPGAQRFGPAVQVDPKDIGDGSAAYPSLAMAPDGRAYVAYRVVTNSLVGSTIVPLRPGDELIGVRVARYNGQGLAWTSLGTINNHPELTMRHPSASNAPAIGVGETGNAVVAWQEPDSSGAARIWARRIFGTTLGNPLQVSPESLNGRPITAEADAPAIAVSKFGGARIAYRLAGGSGSPYGGARILVNGLPREVDLGGGKLTGATVVGGAAAAVGPPSVSIDTVGEYHVAYTANGAAQLAGGDEFHPPSAPVALGAAAGERAPSTLNPSGGGVSAWQALSATGLPTVAARESFAAGGYQLAQLSAPISGPVGVPALGGSGEGDALIAFAQGPPDQQQVMAAVAKAPPGGFLATAPVGWVRGGSAKIEWTQAPEAFGASSYAVEVDGRVVRRGLTGLSLRLSPRGLGDGVHQVQVLATDSLGQQTLTPPAELKVDASPPQVSVRRLGGGGVRVRVFSRASGAVARDTSIAWGDGARARGRLTASHSYARAGTYTIVIHSRDHVGNVLAAHMRVQVR